MNQWCWSMVGWRRVFKNLTNFEKNESRFETVLIRVEHQGRLTVNFCKFFNWTLNGNKSQLLRIIFPAARINFQTTINSFHPFDTQKTFIAIIEFQNVNCVCILDIPECVHSNGFRLVGIRNVSFILLIPLIHASF